jgi:protease-4
MKRVAFTLAAALLASLAASTVSAQITLRYEERSGPTEQQQQHWKVAHIAVGTVVEAPEGGVPLFGGRAAQPLKDLVERLRQARADQEVKAVIVDLNGAEIGLGQMAEVRDEMRKLATAEKAVYVTMDSLDTRLYALASAATHINVTPTGGVDLIGLYSRQPYLKGLLDMLGVQADFVHMGDYKTAAEPLTRSEPSGEAKVMSGWLWDSLYESIVKMIAEGRKLTPDRVREIVNGGPYTAEEALRLGLVDSVQHQQEFLAGLRRDGSRIVPNYGSTAENPFADMPEDPFGMAMELVKMLKGRKLAGLPAADTIAVVYVDGAIQSGESKPSIFGGSGAHSTTICKALDGATEDPSVKAIVLRVNSPGGSALASEVMWDAVRRAGQRKPLVVSMGNVAASGGYYVSAGAAAIYAEPTTITGSIGVVGGKFVTSCGWGKLRVAWHVEKRGDHAGIYSPAAPFSDGERARVTQQMEAVYGTFKSHVVDGRGSKLTKPIDELAGGRVYTGAQALELGLVDRIGGVQDAIKDVASKAGVRDYRVISLPAPPTLMEMLSGGSGSSLSIRRAAQNALAGAGGIDPDGLRAVLNTVELADVLAAERVAAMDASLAGTR